MARYKKPWWVKFNKTYEGLFKRLHGRHIGNGVWQITLPKSMKLDKIMEAMADSTSMVGQNYRIDLILDKANDCWALRFSPLKVGM